MRGLGYALKQCATQTEGYCCCIAALYRCKLHGCKPNYPCNAIRNDVKTKREARINTFGHRYLHPTSSVSLIQYRRDSLLCTYSQHTHNKPTRKDDCSSIGPRALYAQGLLPLDLGHCPRVQRLEHLGRFESLMRDRGLCEIRRVQSDRACSSMA